MEDLLRMIRGFRHFREDYFAGTSQLYRSLQNGQQPKTLMIACSDSRVDPALITRSRPGDLFVIRNVANLVPPYEPDDRHHGVSAALEYAVKFLQVEHIVVLGHANCGGIRALMGADGEMDSEFIRSWMTIAAAARQEVRDRLAHKPVELQLRACEEAAILLSIENLLSFPWIAERTASGVLSIHGWYFDLHTGELLDYDPASGEFLPLK